MQICPFVLLKHLLNTPTALAQVSSQSLLRNIVQTLLHNLDNTAAVTGVRIFQVLTHPNLHIGNLREGIAWSLLAGVQLGKADTETELVDIGIGNDIIRRGGHRRVYQQLDQALGSKGPTLGISGNESF